MIKIPFIRFFVPAPVIVLTLILLSVTALAGEWQNLYGLNDEQLSEKIVALRKSLAQNPESRTTLKTLGIACHFKAKNQTKIFAPQAVEYLQSAYELDKKDYVTMCYLGSAISRMATTTWNPIKKMSYVNKGTGLMDKAVRKAPDNVDVRMARGKTSLAMPAFLGRGDLARVDFEHLAELVDKNPDLYEGIREEVDSTLSELREDVSEKTTPGK